MPHTQDSDANSVQCHPFGTGFFSPVEDSDSSSGKYHTSICLVGMTQESSRTSFSTQAEVSGPHWLTFRDQGTQCPDEQSQKHHVFSGLSLRKVNSTSCSGDAECSMGGTLVRTCCAFCDQTSSVSVPGVSYLPSTVGRNRDNTPWAFLWS